MSSIVDLWSKACHNESIHAQYRSSMEYGHYGVLLWLKAALSDFKNGINSIISCYQRIKEIVSQVTMAVASS